MTGLAVSFKDLNLGLQIALLGVGLILSKSCQNDCAMNHCQIDHSSRCVVLLALHRD